MRARPCLVVLTLALPAAALPQARDNAPARPAERSAAGAGLAEPLAWGDYDADGLDDALAVTPGGGVQLLRNAGDGALVDATAEAGLDLVAGARFALWEDFDGDGAVDLFVGTGSGPCQLLRNRGGAFVDVTASSGITATGLDHAAHWIDYDGDGRRDLHLVNANENTIYHALEGGAFEPIELPRLAPAAGGAFGLASALDAAPEGDDAATSARAPRGAAAPSSGAGAGATPRSARERGERGSGSLEAGASLGGVVRGPGGAVAGSASGFCAGSLEDQANPGTCLQASSTPTLGMLYPISSDLFVAGTGQVLLNSTTPFGVGQLEITTDPSDGGSTRTGVFAVAGDVSNGFDSFGGDGGRFVGGSILPGTTIVSEAGKGVVGIGGSVLDGLSFPGAGVEGIGGGGSGAGVVARGGQPSGTALFGFGGSGDVSTPGGDGAFLTGGVEARGLYVFGGGSFQPSGTGGIGVEATGGSVNQSLATGGIGLVGTGGDASGIDTDAGRGAILRGGQGTAPNTTGGEGAQILGGSTSMGGGSGGNGLFAAGGNTLGGGSFPGGHGAVVVGGSSPTWVGGTGLIATGGNGGEGGPGVVGTGGVSSGGPAATSVGVLGYAGGDAADGVQGETAFTFGAGVRGKASSATSAGVVAEHSGGGTALFADGDTRVGTAISTHRLNVESTDQETLRLVGPLGSFGHGARLNFGDIDLSGLGYVYVQEDVDDSLEIHSTGRTALTGGNVGVNTLTPTFTLEVNGSAGKPGGGSWSVSSDARLKKNVRDLEGALDTLLALRGVTFEYEDPAALRELPGVRTGFIAQEVEEVLPDWVDEVGGYKRLTVRGFEALAVEALRELQVENDALRARVARLEELEERVARVEDLEQDLAALRASLASLLETR